MSKFEKIIGMSKKKKLIADIKKSLEIVWREKGKDLKEKKKRKGEEFAGSGYSFSGRIKQIIDIQNEYYNETANEFAKVTKHKLDIYKTGKLNEKFKKEIRKTIEGKYIGSVRSLEQDVKQSIAGEGSVTGRLHPHIMSSISSLITHKKEAIRKVEEVIDEYNLNPQNWLRRQKDKIIITIFIIIIGAILEHFLKVFEKLFDYIFKSY